MFHKNNFMFLISCCLYVIVLAAAAALTVPCCDARRGVCGPPPCWLSLMMQGCMMRLPTRLVVQVHRALHAVHCSL